MNINFLFHIVWKCRFNINIWTYAEIKDIAQFRKYKPLLHCIASPKHFVYIWQMNINAEF